MTVAAVTFVVGSIFLKETHSRKIWDEVRRPSGIGEPNKHTTNTIDSRTLAGVGWWSVSDNPTYQELATPKRQKV